MIAKRNVLLQGRKGHEYFLFKRRVFPRDPIRKRIITNRMVQSILHK